jgi:hypothetical protein
MYERFKKPAAGFRKICRKQTETAARASSKINAIVISFFIFSLSIASILHRRN